MVKQGDGEENSTDTSEMENSNNYEESPKSIIKNLKWNIQEGSIFYNNPISYTDSGMEWKMEIIPWEGVHVVQPAWQWIYWSIEMN